MSTEKTEPFTKEYILACDILTESEKNIIIERLFLKKTFIQLAGMRKLTKWRCSQIFKNAYKKFLNIDHIETLQTPIENSHFSARIKNCLSDHGITTFTQLAELDEKTLMKLRNMGRKSCRDIQWKLESFGLSLRRKND